MSKAIKQNNVGVDDKVGENESSQYLELDKEMMQIGLSDQNQWYKDPNTPTDNQQQQKVIYKNYGKQGSVKIDQIDIDVHNQNVEGMSQGEQIKLEQDDDQINIDYEQQEEGQNQPNHTNDKRIEQSENQKEYQIINEGNGEYVDDNDGSIYIGDWVEINLGQDVVRHKHGQGQCKYENRSVYYGDWIHNNKHGWGYFIDNQQNKYIGQFVDDRYHGEGAIQYDDGSYFKGNFQDGYKQGKGCLVYANGQMIEEVWLYDQMQDKVKDSFIKSTKKKTLGLIESCQMWAQKQKVYQMICGHGQFGTQDNYIYMVAKISEIFGFIYLIFGVLVRSIYIDFVGPFIVFGSQYWMIRKQGDAECGGLKESQLWMINYIYLTVYSAVLMMVMIMLIIKYRDDFKQQLGWLQQYLGLKAEIAQIEYQKIYGKVKNNLKAEKQGSKQMQLQNHNANRLNTNHDSDNHQLVNNKQQQPQDLQEIKHRLNELKDKSGIIKYKQLDEVNERQMKQKFNYSKVFSKLMAIVSTARMDIDLLSDSMAVGSCYVLSQSMNLSQEIRDDLTLYYNCSLVILIVSMVPKYICWVYLILTVICKKMGIAKGVYDNYDTSLIEQEGFFGKLIFYIYRYVAKLYGINYTKESEYKVNERYFYTMFRLWCINHEDMFIADSTNLSFNPCQQLNYGVMDRQIHPSLKVDMFRTLCENIPQLVLQYSMVSALQRSNVEDCKKTNLSFQLSIIMTIINMVLGFITISKQMIRRLVGGDLVEQEMKSVFRQYLEQLKIKYTGDEIVVDGKYTSILGHNETTDIEVWPKMIESLYDFLIQNTQYTQIVFQDNDIVYEYDHRISNPTTVKGQVGDYLKLIETMKGKTSLSQKVNVRFQIKNKSKQQIILELVIQKIFNEFLLLDSQIEYVNTKKFMLFTEENKLIIKNGRRYLDDIKSNTEVWFELLDQKQIEIWVDITDSQQMVGILYSHFGQDVSKLVSWLMKRGDSLKIVIDAEIFDINLFMNLVSIKDTVGYLEFNIKNKRIEQLVQDNKLWISRIQYQVDEQEVYEYYFSLHEQIKGFSFFYITKYQLERFKAEVGSLYHDSTFLKYYNKQSADDKQKLRNMLSFDYAEIHVNRKFGSFDQNMDVIKQAKGLGVKQLKNRIFGLNQCYDEQILENIGSLKQSNSEFRFMHSLNNNSGEQQQPPAYGQDQNKIKLKNFLKQKDIRINEIEFNIPQQFESIDQCFECYVNQSNRDIFTGLDKMIVHLSDEQDLVKILELKKGQSMIKSTYSNQIKTIQIVLQFKSESIDMIIELVDVLRQIYHELEKVDFSLQSGKEDVYYKEVLFKTVNKKHAVIECREQVYDG